ncbi:MAG: tetratricopeptide repeat protein [Aeoliella sp.]
MSLLRFPILSSAHAAVLLVLTLSVPAVVAQETAEEETPAAETAATDEALEVDPDNPGQPDLDKATQLKLTAEDGRQMGQVIKLLESSLEKGLDQDNREFAEQMLAASLLERAAALSRMVLDRPLPNPRQDPRWIQVRQLALDDLQRVAEIDGSPLEAYLLMGRLQQLPGGDAKAATEAFTTVIDAEDVSPQLQAEAYARRAAGQTDEQAQLADLNKAVEIDGDSIEYRLLRARHYFATKQYETCLADVDDVLEIKSDNFATHELRALVLLALDRQEEALASFDRATELSPEAVSPYLRRAELYGNLGDLDQAIKQATEAIELRSENPIGYLMRADLYLRNEQPKPALEDAEKALELRPGLVQAYLLKARAYDIEGDTRKALLQLEELAEALPPQAELNLQIALYALQLEMPRRAIDALNRALNVEPENALLLRFRGDARLNIGQHREAIADYELALGLEPEDSGILNNLAWTLATSPNDEVRDGKRAIELATKACELTENKEAHIISTLAAAYAESGDFEKAKEWSQKAVDLDDEENSDQISEELASYEAGKPWRESQQLDAGEREGAEESPADELNKPSESTPAPGRTIDF